MSELPFTTATGTDVTVRFCPSPTGTPHVGMVRTALFNWAYARHTGGRLVFRVEDTDAARDSEESYLQLVDALRWLGIDWDEGVETGGPAGPYRQSQRGEIYQDVIARLKAAGFLYESFVTPEEMEARNREAGRDPRQGYDNHERELTEAQREAFRAEGRRPSLRLRVPDTELSYVDLIRGPVTFPAGSFTDFVVVRPNGAPLYTLVNPVDDALMGITHVLRGEDIMSSTPRQIALYLALIEIGVTDFVPRFAHMPLVLGEGAKKLSKRDPESNLFHHRDRGFVPEGLINALALLGWSIAADRDVFTTEELVAAFDIADVNPNPARFDQKKADAINGDHIRMLAPEDFESRIVPYLAGLVEQPPSPAQAAILREAAPLVQERIGVLSEARPMLEFLFTPDAELVVQDDARPREKDLDEARLVLDASIAALGRLEDFAAEPIEAALRAELIEGAGLKPRTAFGPLRAGVSGRRISPPLFESMEILGKASTLARLTAYRRTL
ncbi:glutamate--tRNA ligase [Homoserinibacter sp. YIM 151385]|uniref:glutamate--tRNA ligase n=1 Tax=Homoserinibacter sp. YIM 151385 TaxID=2985506 RepID=UPI0022EFE645|nr:glutamate--tRNA ligase [Homoserinibacter sp. YIM 151385]WBU39266.1 glutamate--tRNA ligase [Homoserinibacter sp. YIM 151385]